MGRVSRPFFLTGRPGMVARPAGFFFLPLASNRQMSYDELSQ